MTYDHQVLKVAIEEFLLGLEVGDIYTGVDLATHLSTYRGISKKDKRDQYARSEQELMRSTAYFVSIANRLIQEHELPILKRKRRSFKGKTLITYYDHEIVLENGIEKHYFEYVGE